MYHKFIKLSLTFLLIVTMFSPAAFAMDDVPYNSIYHDAKLDFKLDLNPNKHEYTITLTRKDDDFNKYYIMLIYNVIVKDANSPYPANINDYITIEPNTKSTTVTRHLLASQTFLQVKEQSYGIKFPPFTEIKGDPSLPDTFFNLCLKYRDPQLKWETPCVDYYFYRRDNKPMDCKVILRRPVVTVGSNGKVEKEWLTFTLDPTTSSSKGITSKKGLKEFFTVFRDPLVSPEEYYIQFVK